jgi:hypothetical protein
MLLDQILILIGAIGLIIGSITDFKKREVADWLNFSLIAAGLGIRLIYALLYGDWIQFGFGFAWFLIAFAFGSLMYYTGQWGGGDVKIIMGLGALTGFLSPEVFVTSSDMLQYVLPSWMMPGTFMIHFMINSFLLGALYGIVMMIIQGFVHHKQFVAESIAMKRYFIWSLFGALAILVLGYVFLGITGQIVFVLQLLLWIIILSPFVLLATKVVEKACMIRMMAIKDLTEGEWIVDDVMVDGKRICGPKDLGIHKEAIVELLKLEKKGKISEVKVKIGIPFVPAFFLAYFVTFAVGNVLYLFV